MSGEDSTRSGKPAPDAASYERRLRGGMRLMQGKDRDAVAREIMSGISAQTAARGGDFASISKELDDPRWVGMQMVRVYGIATPWKLAFVLLAALLAWASAPGALVGPATDGAAIAVSMAAFAALLGVIFALIVTALVPLSTIAAGASAATRLAVLALPQQGVALFDLLTAGELALYLLATLLLVVVAGVPALVLRWRGGEA